MNLMDSATDRSSFAPPAARTFAPPAVPSTAATPQPAHGSAAHEAPAPAERGQPLNISATELATGIAKETLRVWERRYGFPRPARDVHGERLYPADQVERLALVKRALDLGHRPGRALALPAHELHRLAGAPSGLRRPRRGAPLHTTLGAPWLALLQQSEPQALRRALLREMGRLGLERFVLEVAAPLAHTMGEAWHHGHIEVFQEHAATQTLSVLLREAIDAAANPYGMGPRVLLTTLPGEQHGLGLLMAEVLFTLRAARCQSLGLQTPPAQIALAAARWGADVVALSCTPCVPARTLLAGLAELRQQLSPEVPLWAGGSAPALHRQPIAGVRVFDSLVPIASALAAWQAARVQAPHAPHAPQAA